MTPLSIQVPFPVFQDRDGQPLDNGYVWIGQANLNPLTNPVVAYFDAALTIVAAQPLRTINGYVSRAGTPSQIYVDGVNFSILVQDSKGSMVYNFPDGTGIGPDACGVTYNPPFTGAISYPVCEKLEQVISVQDFGAVGDGIADDFLAINRAVAYVSSIGGGTVFYPAGTYRITRSIRLDDFDVDTNTYSGNVRRNIVHQGAGRDSTIIKTDGFYACAFTSFPEPFIPNGSISPAPAPPNVLCSNIVIKDMTLDGNKNVVGDGGTTYGLYYQTSPEATGGWPNGYVGQSYWPSDTYQFAIHLYYGERLLVENVHIKDWWYSGVLGWASARIEVHNSFIETCGNIPTVIGYYAGFNFDQRTNTVNVSGNIIQTCGRGVRLAGGGASQGSSSPVSYIIIEDNIFYDMKETGIVAADFLKNIIVSNNLFDTIARGGILFTLDGIPGQLGTELPKDIIISNNIVNDFNLENIDGTRGISCIGHNFTVTGNQVLQTNPGVTDNTIGIATVDGPVTPGTGERKGHIVTGNFVSGNFPNANAGVGILYIDSENALVANNTIYSNGAVAQTAITLFGANAVVQGNNIRGTYVQTNRAIFKFAGSSNMYVDDSRYGAITAIHTTVASGSISGSNNVDFSALSTVVDIDNRANYDAATDSISPDLPGVYEFTAVLRVTAASASVVQVAIELNNVTTVASAAQSAGAGSTVTVTLSGFATLSGSDVMRLKANAGASNYVVESFSSLSAKFVRQTSL